MKKWINASTMLVAALLIQPSGCGSPADDAAATDAGSGRGTTPEPPWTAPFGGSRQCYVTNARGSAVYDSCRSDCWWHAVNNPSFDCIGMCSDAWPCGISRTECAVHSY